MPRTAPRVDLGRVVDRVRGGPAMAQKAAIAAVRDVFGPGDFFSGPGDDGAVVPVGAEQSVVCGEAILPSFAQADPFGAGLAAVLANVNDLAAMGAEPLAIVDALTGDEDHCRRALEGLRAGSRLYDVPVVGGHLTVTEGPASVSAFALGRCTSPLSATAAAPGQHLLVLSLLDGHLREDFPFFRSFDERGGRLAGDVRLLPELAAAGLCRAAKDVSMAGLLGSIAMLLEPSACGVAVDLDAIRVPEGVTLEQWLLAFPCYAFLLLVPATSVAECARRASRRSLALDDVGCLDSTGVVRLTQDGDEAVLVDFATDQVTGLRDVPR